MRLLRKVLEIVEVATRVANEGYEQYVPASTSTSTSRSNHDGLPPAAFAFRTLFTAQSHAARSSALAIKSLAYLLRWRRELILPRLNGLWIRGSWGQPAAEAHLNCCVPLTTLTVLDGATPQNQPQHTVRPNPLIVAAPEHVVAESPWLLAEAGPRQIFETAEDVAATASLLGPAAPPPTMSTLISLLRSSDLAVLSARESSRREALFAVHVLHGVVQVGSDFMGLCGESHA